MSAARSVKDRLPVVLIAVLALLYAWIGATAHDWDRVWGVAGAVLVLAAVLLRRWSRSVALVVLTAGALPLAIATWWSLVTPLLALLVLVLGWTTLWWSPEQRVSHKRVAQPEGSAPTVSPRSVTPPAVAPVPEPALARRRPAPAQRRAGADESPSR